MHVNPLIGSSAGASTVLAIATVVGDAVPSAHEGSVVLVALAAIGTLLGIIYGVRYKSNADAAEHNATLAQQLAAMEAQRAELLKQERDEALEKLGAATVALDSARQTIHRLEQLPNLEKVLDMMSRSTDKVRERIEHLSRDQDQAAQRRHLELLSELRRGT